MHTANESGNGEVPSRVEVFMVFGNELRWFEVQKECNAITYAEKIMWLDSCQLILIRIWIFNSFVSLLIRIREIPICS